MQPEETIPLKLATVVACRTPKYKGAPESASSVPPDTNQVNRKFQMMSKGTMPMIAAPLAASIPLAVNRQQFLSSLASSVRTG